jgi:hypothetical protein
LFEGFVQGQHLLVIDRAGDGQSVEFDVFSMLTSPEGVFAAGSFDQDPTHGFRGGGEEVCAILPGGLSIASESQPSLMHQSGGLQRVARGLALHLLSRQLAELAIDASIEFFDGRRTSTPGFQQQVGYVTGHGRDFADKGKSWMVRETC